MHRRVPELSPYLSGDSSALSTTGRQARSARTHRAFTRLRRDLPDECELYVARVNSAQAHVRGMRRSLFAMRRELRRDRRGSIGGLCRSMPELCGIVRADGRIKDDSPELMVEECLKICTA